MFLDIIHRLVHFLKNHNVSETEFCLRLQVKPTQLDPIDRARPSPEMDKTMDNVQKHNICKRITAGGVIFFGVRVVSKESRRLVLPRTSCFRLTSTGKVFFDQQG
jgi:hypothetical protein